MADKFGPYINRIMTTILDKEQDEFVKELSWSELNRLKDLLVEFLMKNRITDERKEEKQLLQVDKKNVK